MPSINWEPLIAFPEKRGRLRHPRWVYFNALRLFLYLNGWGRIPQTDFAVFKKWDLPALYNALRKAQNTGRLPLAFVVILLRRKCNPWERQARRSFKVSDQMELHLETPAAQSCTWEFIYRTGEGKQRVRITNNNLTDAAHEFIKKTFNVTSTRPLENLAALGTLEVKAVRVDEQQATG